MSNEQELLNLVELAEQLISQRKWDDLILVANKIIKLAPEKGNIYLSIAQVAKVNKKLNEEYKRQLDEKLANDKKKLDDQFDDDKEKLANDKKKLDDQFDGDKEKLADDKKKLDDQFDGDKKKLEYQLADDKELLEELLANAKDLLDSQFERQLADDKKNFERQLADHKKKLDASQKILNKLTHRSR